MKPKLSFYGVFAEPNVYGSVPKCFGVCASLAVAQRLLVDFQRQHDPKLELRWFVAPAAKLPERRETAREHS